VAADIGIVTGLACGTMVLISMFFCLCKANHSGALPCGGHQEKKQSEIYYERLKDEGIV